ncbi:MAG: PD40 domain-containing protein [Chloroflexi bacterium]|nr:PD40 domain-containing protein [Chloroflexota bacterium]
MSRNTQYALRNTLYALLLALLLTLGLGVSSGPALAQENTRTPVDDLDTNLARAAAKSFLITLTRPELAGTMNFYLADDVKESNILSGLQNPPVAGFEITATSWATEKTYQVQATLQPENRQVIIYTGKYNGRWLVEGIDLLLASATSGTAANAAAAATTPSITPMAGNGSGKLVFQTQSGGGIYIIGADGTDLRYVTSGIDPQLSPDGTKIAFTRWEPEYTLFTINVDGSNEQSWTKGWRQMKSPTWSADGSSLVFSWQNGGRLDEERREISLADAAQNEDGVNVPSNAREVEIENGILKFKIPADAFWSLKEINLATGQLVDLPTDRYSYGPTGHPTAANLLIYKGKNGVALLDLKANKDQPVSHDFRDHTPVISPVGNRVAVSYWQDGHWEIHTLNLDGSGRQKLTDTPLTVIADKTQLNTQFVDGKERIVPTENPYWNHAAPAWSPDGQQIAFMTDRSGKWEMWIMNADGSNQRPMFPNGALDNLTFNYAGVDERMISWR